MLAVLRDRMQKDPNTYIRLQRDVYKRQVGNSPRSDINPALQIGLNAVFLPHTNTWHLEHAELESGTGRLLILASFRDLRSHF